MHNGKSTITESIGSLTITIPSKKNWFILIFGTVWLGGWYFGLISATSMLTTTNGDSFRADGFIIFWLTGWTVGGLSIIFLLLWGFFGKEKLELDGRELWFEKTIFGIGKKKRLELTEVKNFRHEKINTSMFGGNAWAAWGLGPGKIKFDYGMKTYSFGLALDDAEANYLADLLNKKIEG